MPTSAKTGARYTSLYALPFWLQFAPFRDLPSRLDLFNIRFISDILCLI